MAREGPPRARLASPSGGGERSELGGSSSPAALPPGGAAIRALRRPCGAHRMIRKILIVDDSPTERHVLNDMLTRAGYEVIASDSGEDALEKARHAAPDLIVMDVVMPGLNGF